MANLVSVQGTPAMWLEDNKLQLNIKLATKNYCLLYSYTAILLAMYSAGLCCSFFFSWAVTICESLRRPSIQWWWGREHWLLRRRGLSTLPSTNHTLHTHSSRYHEYCMLHMSGFYPSATCREIATVLGRTLTCSDGLLIRLNILSAATAHIYLLTYQHYCMSRQNIKRLQSPLIPFHSNSVSKSHPCILDNHQVGLNCYFLIGFGGW